MTLQDVKIGFSSVLELRTYGRCLISLWCKLINNMKVSYSLLYLVIDSYNYACILLVEFVVSGRVAPTVHARRFNIMKRIPPFFRSTTIQSAVQ